MKIDKLIELMKTPITPLGGSPLILNCFNQYYYKRHNTKSYSDHTPYKIVCGYAKYDKITDKTTDMNIKYNSHIHNVYVLYSILWDESDQIQDRFDRFMNNEASLFYGLSYIKTDLKLRLV